MLSGNVPYDLSLRDVYVYTMYILYNNNGVTLSIDQSGLKVNRKEWSDKPSPSIFPLDRLSIGPSSFR